jgi:hypothetical protein
MKLSHPVAIKTTALLASWIIRGWFSTLSSKVHYDVPEVHPDRTPAGMLYLFWHENLLYPAVVFAPTGVPVLVSQHRDGELITQVVRMMGGQAIRGSTNRHGDAALREMIRHAETGNLAITPDGPRGPRRKVQMGSIFLASRARMKIVPCGFAYAGCWRAGSWDKMAIPKPMTQARGVIGSPIEIPDGLSKDELQPYRQHVQAAMDQCQARADEQAAR